jgi:hypothetical protein
MRETGVALRTAGLASATSKSTGEGKRADWQLLVVRLAGANAKDDSVNVRVDVVDIGVRRDEVLVRSGDVEAKSEQNHNGPEVMRL